MRLAVARFAAIAVLALIVTGSLCKKQQPPGAPSAPAGQASCEPTVAYSYRASTTDPDGDDISYRFDWVDGTMSVWSRYAPSGTEVSFMHSWGTAGTFSVKAQAKDEGGLETGWSAGLDVAVATGGQNQEPGSPGTPSGPTSGVVRTSYDYTSSATDPDGDSVAMRFDWGDGQTSAWSSPVASGEPVAMSHSWGVESTYSVKAQAKDIKGAESEWSAALLLAVRDTLGITASGERTQGGAVTNFSYTFDHDVTLSTLTITFPGYAPLQDPDAPGAKTAGTTYHSDGWNCSGGQMPTGIHYLQFAGSWVGGAFDITVEVMVN